MSCTPMRNRTVPGLFLLCAVVALAIAPAVACSSAGTPTTPTPSSSPGGTPPPSTVPTAEWRVDGAVTPGEYANQLNLGTYRLFWISTEDTIRMAMQSDAQGWVAVGFQPGSMMKNADMVFGKMAAGKAIVQDQYSTGNIGPHSADVNQDATDDLLSFAGERTEFTTTFEFERKLDTGDALDVPLKRDTAMQIIWAYGTSDDEKSAHSTRGYGEIVP